MSIASELTTLAANKAAIKEAIEAKNPATAPTDSLAQWPTAIASIPTGGGSVGGNLSWMCQYIGAFNDNGITIVKKDGTTVSLEIDSGFSNGSMSDVVSYSISSTLPDCNRAGSIAGDTKILLAVPCFVHGTMILLFDGYMKPVESLTYQDDLAVWDFDEGRMSSAKPLWIKKPQESGYFWRSTFRSGKVLDTMGHSGHRVFSLDTDRFEYVTECVGHRVVLADGSSDILVDTVRVESPCCYYNLITDRHIDLYANGVLTGCSLENGLYHVKDMRFVKDGRPVRPFSEFEGAVSREWYDGCRYGESSLDREYLVKYYRDRLPLTAQALGKTRAEIDAFLDGIPAEGGV